MPIRFRCQHCAQLLSIATRRAGADVPCPTCGKTLRVPDESPEGGLPPAVSAPENDVAPAVASHASASGTPATGAASAAVATSASLPAAAIAHPAAPDEDEAVQFPRKPRPMEELDMTPMVDMTFLLLIFFMVTATFGLQKALQMPAPEPEKKGAAQIQRELEDILDGSVRIVVDAQNVVTIDGEKVSDLAGLGGVLREKMRTDQKNRTEAVLQIDPRAFHETVVLVVDGCNEAGMQKIRLAGKGSE